jgi:hypothetical protein
VRAAFAERSTGQIVLGPPKSQAGRRVVGIPSVILPDVREHLAVLTGPAPGALVFPGPKGGPLRRGNFNGQANWPQAVAAIGVTGLHFHDLRHTGNAWAATSGAGLRDLMARMGHDSERAAIIYHHQARARTPLLLARSTLTPSCAATTVTAAPLTAWPRSANATLMARSVLRGLRRGAGWRRCRPLACEFFVERVTRIELALSAWEPDRIHAIVGLIWPFDCPLVTVADPSLPALMAR